MEESPPQRRPQRSGCLKFTCTGCATAIVACCFAAVLVWHYLNRWEPGQSAWEHFPPSTMWAIESHDVKAIADRAIDDPGMRSLILSYDTWLRQIEMTMVEDKDDLSRRPAQEAIDAYRQLSPVFTAIAPNIFGMLRGGVDGQEVMLYLRPPSWLRWALNLGSFSTRGVEFLDDFGVDGMYCGFMDGWLLLSSTREIIEETVIYWSANPSPLGKAANREDAHVMAGFRTDADMQVVPSRMPEALRQAVRPEARQGGAAETSEETDGSEAEAGPPPLFANPFEATPDVQASVEAVRQGYFARFLFLPDGKKWKLTGAVSLKAMEPGAVPDQVFADQAPLYQPPSAPEGAAPSVTVAVRLRPEAYAAGLRALEAKAGDTSSSRAPVLKALVWNWLRDAWLGHASGDFILFAGRPAVAKKPGGVPPMPVVTLGWALPEGDDPGRTADRFRASVAAFFEALASPGGSLLLRSVRGLVSYLPDSDGMGGAVKVPEALLNAMRPAWRFAAADSIPTGWMTTDTTAVPMPGAGRLFSPEIAFFKEMAESGAVVGWDVSPHFIDAVAAVLADKAVLAPESRTADLERAKMILNGFRRFLNAFPAGVINIHLGNDETVRVRGEW